MPNIYFCSFGDRKLKPTLQRIKREAQDFSLFKKIFIYTENNLSLKERKDIHTIISITKSSRGYGYWIWKPVIILKTLKKIKDNNILIYCDAGCELNKNGLPKLYKYIDMAVKRDIVVTQLPPPTYTDLNWTKADTLALFPDIPITKLSEGQIQSGTIILKNNSYTRNIIQQWKNFMTIENLHFFDDSISIKQNNKTFKENRHDQSILSLILKANHFIALPVSHFHSETENGWKELIDEPIWQKRIKEYISVYRFSIKSIIKKIIPTILLQYLKNLREKK
ncbi:MAG: hypothetical protein ACTTIU_05190 [Treponema lecithinolyticum]|uniref:hypothetical protein n=1 Tax=Treponema lecithinolyticum TaxID=53418 RepID=UPI003FA30A3F